MTITSRRRRSRILIALFLVAAGIRIWGCFGQGLPYTFNSDERGNVTRSLRFGAEGTLDPGWFTKPALGYYLIFGEYGCYYLIGRSAGWFGSRIDFGTHFFNHEAPFYLIGRITFSILGALTVLVTARLGRHLGGRRLGIASAMVLTVIVGHVASGQHVKMDVPAALFSTWALVAIVQIMRLGRTRDYVSAGILAGLSMATKYYGIALLVPLVLAHLLRSPHALRTAPRLLWSPRLLAGFVAFVVGFFVGSPYNFLNPKGREYIGRLFEKVRGMLGPGQIFDFEDPGAMVKGEDSLGDTVEHLIGQLTSFQGVGPVLALLLIAGLLRAAIRRGRTDLFLLVTFPYLILVFAFCNSQFARPRHLVVLYPAIAVLAASGFEFLWALATRWRRGSPPSPILALAILLALPVPGFPLYHTMQSNIARTSMDPRLIAVEWIQENIPAGSVILSDGGNFPLRCDRSRINWVLDQRLPQIRVDSEQIFGSLHRQWELELIALDGFQGRAYDVLAMEHHWQSTEFKKRIDGEAGYNELWMHSPWGDLVEPVLAHYEKTLLVNSVEDSWRTFRSLLPEEQNNLAPVEFWIQVTAVSLPWLTFEVTAGEKRYRPVEWLLTTQMFVEEYLEQPDAFPDYFSFYADLVAHYRCHEFPVPDPDHPLARMLTMRIYDLRKRIE